VAPPRSLSRSRCATRKKPLPMSVDGPRLGTNGPAAAATGTRPTPSPSTSPMLPGKAGQAELPATRQSSHLPRSRREREPPIWTPNWLLGWLPRQRPNRLICVAGVAVRRPLLHERARASRRLGRGRRGDGWVEEHSDVLLRLVRSHRCSEGNGLGDRRNFAPRYRPSPATWTTTPTARAFPRRVKLDPERPQAHDQ
jgi:hypothetical protein